MVLERQYTLRSARDLLGVDDNTLRLWLKKHQIDTTLTEGDRRIKFISHTSLVALAKQHGRTLKTPLNPDSSRSSLERRIEALEEALEKLRLEIAVLRSERRPRSFERAYASEDYLTPTLPIDREPPAFRPQTYLVTGNQLSKGGIGRLAFAHGSANSEEYGRKFIAPKIPEDQRASVIGVLTWLQANRPFSECTTDPTCGCHALFSPVPQEAPMTAE